MNEISKLIAEDYRLGGFETIILEHHIQALFDKKTAGPMPAHEIFLAVCQNGLEALKDYQGNLADSPAAPILLGYLQSALQQYLSEIDKSALKPNAADRREFLAKAFGLTGSPGSKISDDQRMEICKAFSSTMHNFACSGETPKPKDITNACRAAYKAHFGKDWSMNDNTSAQGMKTTIRPILRNAGYL